MQSSMPARTGETGIRVQHLPVQGTLHESVSALLAVEADASGPFPLAVAPHDALVLSVSLGRGSDPLEKTVLRS